MRKNLFFRTSAITWVLLIAGVMLFLPRDASAHLVTTGAGPFYDGIAHFFLSFDEILPVIGLALFTGLRGPKYGRWNASIISFAWFIGGIAGLLFPMQQPPSLLSSLLMLLPGILLASDWKLSVRIALAFSALVGVVLGFLNGASVAGSGSNSGPLTMIGASASVLILSIMGSALAVVLSTGWTRIALRVAGSWLAALGLLALGWALKK